MTKEQWGKLAVSLPCWPYGSGPDDHKQYPKMTRRGILWVREVQPWGDRVPDPDHEGTGGLLLYALGGWAGFIIHSRERGEWLDTYRGVLGAPGYPSLGRACISHARNRGTWWPQGRISF